MGRPLALVVDDAEGFRGVVRVLEIWEGINGDEDARVDELRLEDVVGDAEPEALLRTTSTLEDSACTEPLAWDTRRSDLVVCTLPARAAPTCTDRIPLRFHEIERSYDDGDRPRVRRVTRYATRVVLERDGIVVVRESGRVPRAARGVMGRYRITG
ncbi:MAG: hypothetical protein IT379_42985, partial [Deltaproteobacteria bacterium]|nr:hypothetical protein [Deltaproteobacteria bacterium]